MKTFCNYIVMLAAVAVMVGCEDFLEVDMPKDQMGSVAVFNDDKLAEAAWINTYSNLRMNGFLNGKTDGIGFLLACYADDLDVTNPTAIYYRNFFEHSVMPSNEAVANLWNSSYKQIYYVNAVLEGVERSELMSDAMKKQIKGEALAVRAILHFYLAQTFGDVPYVTDTDYEVNRKVGKIGVTEVMNLTVADLKKAEELLHQQYASAERVRINKGAVQAFLARMYLYTENWTLALQYAETVISTPGYEPEQLENLFLKESTSALWQFKPEIGGLNAIEANTYIFEALPAPESRLSQSLLNSFETDDLRKEHWIKFLGADFMNAHAFKYTVRGGSSSNASKEYSVVLRIEEQYLIAAEAAAHLADWDTANGRLNTIRSSRGLEKVEFFETQQLVNAVLKERRAEFFCEFGHRFYDLKRLARLDDLLETKPKWRAALQILPLPENELLLNPNLLPQNTGY